MSDPKKILVVDDEPDMVEWLTTFLEDNDFATISAFNGAEAFEKAKNESPDLITLDITMDEESGMRALKNLQENESTANIPIVIITGITPDLKKFIDRSGQVKSPDAYFEKPVERDALLKRIKELLA
jgi:DNA-binding response OmpR family regulator